MLSLKVIPLTRRSRDAKVVDCAEIEENLKTAEKDGNDLFVQLLKDKYHKDCTQVRFVLHFIEIAI